MVKITVIILVHLVEVIAFEKLLCCGVKKMNLILFYCLGILPFLIVNMMFVEIH